MHFPGWFPIQPQKQMAKGRVCFGGGGEAAKTCAETSVQTAALSDSRKESKKHFFFSKCYEETVVGSVHSILRGHGFTSSILHLSRGMRNSGLPPGKLLCHQQAHRPTHLPWDAFPHQSRQACPLASAFLTRLQTCQCLKENGRWKVELTRLMERSRGTKASSRNPTLNVEHKTLISHYNKEEGSLTFHHSCIYFWDIEGTCLNANMILEIFSWVQDTRRSGAMSAPPRALPVILLDQRCCAVYQPITQIQI